MQPPDLCPAITATAILDTHQVPHHVQNCHPDVPYLPLPMPVVHDGSDVILAQTLPMIQTAIVIAVIQWKRTQSNFDHSCNTDFCREKFNTSRRRRKFLKKILMAIFQVALKNCALYLVRI